MSKVIKIGLLGSGTVGTGVVRVLKENGADIAKKAGAAVVVKKVLVRDVSKKRPYLEDVELTDNAQEIVNDPEIDIVVELMGGLHPAFEYRATSFSTSIASSFPAPHTSLKHLFSFSKSSSIKIPYYYKSFEKLLR